MKIKRVALDSNCIIGLLSGNPEYEVLKEYFNAAFDEKIQLVMSAVALLESLPRATDPNIDLVNTVMQSDLIEAIDLSRSVIKLASELMETHRMKHTDAAILATGILSNCELLLTNDNGFPFGRSLRNKKGEIMEVSRLVPYGTPEIDFSVPGS